MTHNIVPRLSLTFRTIPISFRLFRWVLYQIGFDRCGVCLYFRWVFDCSLMLLLCYHTEIYPSLKVVVEHCRCLALCVLFFSSFSSLSFTALVDRKSVV